MDRTSVFYMFVYTDVLDMHLGCRTNPVWEIGCVGLDNITSLSLSLSLPLSIALHLSLSH